MRSRAIRILALVVLIGPSAGGTCTTAPGGIFNLFGNGVTLVIQNDAGFPAALDVWVGGGMNAVEDVVADRRSLADLGGPETVGAHQSISVAISCDGELEVIAFDGARFTQGGLGVGEVEDVRRMRRDVEFDCGDTVRIRLSGAVFNFGVSVDVEQGAFSSSDDSEDRTDDQTLDEDIAEALDDLFGD